MAQNFGLGLELKLKTTKAGLHKQIAELNSKITRKVNVGVRLKLTKKEINDQLKSLKGIDVTPIKVKIKIDDNVGYINKQIKNINSKITETLNIKPKIDKTNFKSATQEMVGHAKKASSGIKQTWKATGQFLKVDKKSIEDSLISALEEAGNKISKIRVLSDKNLGIEKAVATYKNASGTMVTETMRWKNEVDNAGKVVGRVFETIAIKSEKDFSKSEKKIAKHGLEMRKLGKELKMLSEWQEGKESPILPMLDKNFKTTFNEINSAMKKLNINSNTYDTQLKSINEQMSVLRVHRSELVKQSDKSMIAQGVKRMGLSGFKAEAVRGDVSAQETMKIRTLEHLKKAMKGYRIETERVGTTQERVNGHLQQFHTISVKALKGNEVKRLKFYFHEATGQIRKMNEETSKLSLKDMGAWGKFKSAMSAFPVWMSAATLWMQAIRAAREGVRYIVEMDKAMTDLSKVTELTAQGLNDMRVSAVEIGKELGKSSLEIAQSFAEIARVYKDTGDIEKFAKVATIASNVTTMTAESASKAISKTMITFKMNLDEAGTILDQWNEIQNNYRKGMRY